MKIKLALILFSIICSQNILAQENNRNQKDVVRDKRIYFYLEEQTNIIKYFVKDMGKDGNAKINNYDVFSLKNSNECGIYFRWLNPLNYRIAFKDTVYVSPSDVAINDFIKSYLSAFDATNSESISSKKSLNDAIAAMADSTAMVDFTSATKLGSDLIVEKKPAFGTKDLNLLLIQLLNSKFKSSDSLELNELIDNLHTLENLHTNNIAELINKDFIALKNLRDYAKVLSETDKVSDDIANKYEVTLKQNIDAQKQFDPLKFVVTNKPIEAFVKIVVKDFIKEVNAKYAADKELIQKLKEIIQVLVKSVSTEESADFAGFYQIKSVEFMDNQNYETSFIVSKYDIDSKNYELIKKSDLITRNIIFEKYDPVKINLSTGIFYASYNLKAFGVAQGTSNLVVTEDEIRSSTAIPAIFLNFLFDLGSRNFLPILQFGADPTKKRPFILLGGGIGIPSSRFAITGGPIWTWDASLDKLIVGQEVASTTELEQDTKYAFDMCPKGWYLGLQFNF